jgi:hypothetical protein
MLYAAKTKPRAISYPSANTSNEDAFPKATYRSQKSGGLGVIQMAESECLAEQAGAGQGKPHHEVLVWGSGSAVIKMKRRE